MTDTFGAQVIAASGVDYTDDIDVIDTNVSLYLEEGYRDVVAQVAKTKPHELHLFSYTWNSIENITSDDTRENNDFDHYKDQEITSSGVHIPSGIIINVWRADGRAARRINQCTQLNASLKYKATDKESLSYRGKNNPCYYWEYNKVYILPAPSGTEGKAGGVDTDDAYDNEYSADYGLISYVRYEPINIDTITVSIIPDVYTRLIVIYASIKVLEAKMAKLVLIEEDNELASALQANIAVLNQKYQGHFATASAPGGGGGGKPTR